MQRKFTLALFTLILSLAAAIHAAPLLETRDVVELPEARDLLLPESDLQERSTLDLSDEEDLFTREFDDDLGARDMPDDPLEELTLRGPMRAAQNKKKAEKKKAAKAYAKAHPILDCVNKALCAAGKAVKNAVGAGGPTPGRGAATRAPARVAPKVAGAAAGPVTKANSLKGAAMQAHIAAQRAAKGAAKNAQRGAGFEGSKKAKKAAERKENRAAAKLQHQRATVGKPGSPVKYDQRVWQPTLQGKIVDKNTPSTKKEETARTNRKAAGLAAYNALSAPDKAARVAAQNAKVAHDLTTKDARRDARSATKKAATAARKADRKNQITYAREEYKKSIDTKTFPGRKTDFKTPQGNAYTGRDVRQALFTAHAAAHNGKGVGYNSDTGKQEPKKFRHPKEFENRENSDKSTPLPKMEGKGREFGMLSGKVAGFDGRSPNPTETRLITQANAAGVHEFKGVVAHPTKEEVPAKDDHVKVGGSRFGIPLPGY